MDHVRSVRAAQRIRGFLGPGHSRRRQRLGIVSALAAYEGANAVTQLNPVLDYLHDNTELRIELKTYQLLAEPILGWQATAVVATPR